MRVASKRFLEKRSDGAAEFQEFCSANSAWLDDYCLYVGLKEEMGEPWFLWPQGLRDRDDLTLAEARLRLSDVIEREMFAQFQFFRQWASLKRYCNGLGIGLVGDISFYVGADSADTWSQQGVVQARRRWRPAFVGGVPPDYFSQTGSCGAIPSMTGTGSKPSVSTGG